MRSVHLLIVLAAIACQSKDEGPNASDTIQDPEQPDDTDTPDLDDTGADDTGTDDTATDDTGTEPGPAPLYFFFERDMSGLTLVLNHMDFGAGTIGDELMGATVTGDGEAIDPGTPPVGHMTAFDSKKHPGFEVAYYLPSLIEDDNANARHDDGELVVGMGTQLPLYVTGPIPGEFAALGMVEGWNVIVYDLDEPGSLALGETQGVVLAQLPNSDEITIGGTMGADLSEQELQQLGAFAFPEMTTSAAPEVEEAWIDAFVMDAPLSDTGAWSATVSATPAAWMAPVDDLLQLPLSPQGLYFYIDYDEDNAFSSGDEPGWTVCSSLMPAFLVWIDRPRTLDTAFGLLLTGIGTGWTAATTAQAEGELFRPLSSYEATHLSWDESCN